MRDPELYQRRLSAIVPALQQAGTAGSRGQ